MDLRRLLLLIPTVAFDAEAWTWRKEERFGELVLFFKGDRAPTQRLLEDDSFLVDDGRRRAKT